MGGCYTCFTRKVDIRLPGKGDSNSHGARPVHQKYRWIRTSRLSMKNSLSETTQGHPASALYCWILEILYRTPKGRRALLQGPSTVGRSVCLCWEHLKPKGPNGRSSICLARPPQNACLQFEESRSWFKINFGIFPTALDLFSISQKLTLGIENGACRF